MIDLPLGLKSIFETGTGVLFLGAGIGHHCRTQDGRSAPDASTLARELAKRFNVAVGDQPSLSQVAAIVELRAGRPELLAYLKKRLTGLSGDEVLQWLLSRRWAAIFTTNYDAALERTYELLPEPPQKPVVLTLSSDLVRHDPRFEVPICHIHGALFSASDPEVLISEHDYAHFREQRRMLFEFLKLEFATSPVVYIGYANRDRDWGDIIAEIGAEFYPAPVPHSYRIAPSTDPLDAEILASQNVMTVDATLQDLYAGLRDNLPEATLDSDRYLAAQDQVPPDFKYVFEARPAATLRLVTSWTYVNQGNRSGQLSGGEERGCGAAEVVSVEGGEDEVVGVAVLEA